ncbi:cytochrome P450 [Halenospora varia]|nr:cytochrome P450 [Halenospora varia]
MLDVSLVVGTLFLVFLGTQVLTYCVSFYQTSQSIKSTWVPKLTCYTWRDDMITWLISPWIAPIVESLPFGWGHWIRYTKRDFNWWSKGDLAREELGDVYWTVAPGGPQLWVSDASIITQVIQRRQDFVKKVSDYRATDLYGRNVLSSEGTIWQRHRRITGPPFNEKNSNLVFDETNRQGKAMLAAFIHDADGSESIPGKEPVVDDLCHWTMTAALNVIASASLSIKSVWPTHSVAAPGQKGKTLAVPKGFDEKSSGLASLPQESFDLVMNNIRLLIIMPRWLMRISPFELLRDSAQASEDFRKYMYGLIAGHKARIESGEEDTGSDDDHAFGSADLLASIVKGSTGSKAAGLTDEEMIGNIFIFVLAGHETTATTIQSGLVLLACNPQDQIRVQEEIDEIWAGKKEGGDLTYDDYPKMRVIMALMLETLRTYPPVVLIPKVTTADQSLEYEGKTIDLPAGSRISIDVVSLHRNPKYWGSDNHEFKPSRWLMLAGYVPPPDTNDESPSHINLYHPPKNAFFAFNGGFRGCLGRKFAQVEFATIIAVLLKDHTVELVDEGKGWEDAKKKALDGLNNRMSDVAMRMRGKVKVRFVRRGKESFPPRT